MSLKGPLYFECFDEGLNAFVPKWGAERFCPQGAQTPKAFDTSNHINPRTPKTCLIITERNHTSEGPYRGRGTGPPPKWSGRLIVPGGRPKGTSLLQTIKQKALYATKVVENVWHYLPSVTQPSCLQTGLGSDPLFTTLYCNSGLRMMAPKRHKTVPSWTSAPAKQWMCTLMDR